MRVAGPPLALSFLLLAAPALAQGGGYYDSDSPYDRQQMNQDRFDRYEYYPPPQGQMWQGPMQQGEMRPGPMPEMMHRQHMMQHRQRMMQQGPQGGSPPWQMGQTGQSGPSAVSFATQSQIKQSLESSGFKNVTVLPQSYLIRATAPDGSRIVMQVSSEGLYGVVVNPADQGGASGTGGGTSTSSASSPGSNTASSSPGSTSTSNPGSTSSSPGSTSSPSSSSSSSPSSSTSTGNTSGTGGTSSSTGQSTNR